MRYLLDTTWIVEYLRGNADVISRVQALLDGGLAVSLISVAELYEGVFRSQDPVRNEAALKSRFIGIEGVTVLGLTEDVCVFYGRERARLYQRGNIVGAIDLLIAATALTHNLTLLTDDRDFERIGDLRVNFA